MRNYLTFLQLPLNFRVLPLLWFIDMVHAYHVKIACMYLDRSKVGVLLISCLELWFSLANFGWTKVAGLDWCLMKSFHQLGLSKILREQGSYQSEILVPGILNHFVYDFLWNEWNIKLSCIVKLVLPHSRTSETFRDECSEWT